MLKKFQVLLLFISLAFTGASQDILPYEMYTNHFKVDGYTKQYDRSFDSAGIILQWGHYHPLTISIYGILCHAEFIKTGDSTFYYAVLDQYKYFQDTTRLDYAFDNKGVGLPYDFNFNDLKPKWYSGLAQGCAVSFLLRYYEFSGDEKAKELAKKIGYFMIQRDVDGGTMSLTPEGGLWLEEYAGTKRSVNVLNGFINALVGLKEYCDFFPEDSVARDVHTKVYSNFLKLTHKFDRPQWTSYDRNGKGISLLYIRLQTAQLDHLYSIYGDEQLRRQMMIWSMMQGVKQDTELKFYMNPDYLFSNACQEVKGADGSVAFELDFGDRFYKNFIKNESVKTYDNKGGLHSLTDLKLKKNVEVHFGENLNEVKIEFNSSIPEGAFQVFGNDNGIAGDALKFSIDSNVLIVKSEVPMGSIELRCKKKPCKKLKMVEQTNYNYRTNDIPMFGHHWYKNVPTLIKGHTYLIDLPVSGAQNVTLFYRWAPNYQMMPKAIWRADRVITDMSEGFTPDQNGVYEFFVSYEIATAKSSVGQLTLID